MTSAQLWRLVGEILLLKRNTLQWNASDVERHGGPTYKTVQAIEQGRVGRVGELSKHCDALGLKLADVLQAALDKTSKPLSPEALQVVRKYERTHVHGRQALLALAQALPDVEEGPAMPRPPRSDPQRSEPRKK